MVPVAVTIIIFANTLYGLYTLYYASLEFKNILRKPLIYIFSK